MSSAEGTFSSRVLQTLDSRKNVKAHLFTLAYRGLELAVVSFWMTASAVHAAYDSVLVGVTGANCIEDAGCVNRLWPRDW